jgi:hypothetical protein
MNTKVIAEAIKKRFTTLRDSQQEIFDRVEQFKAMYRCQMEEDDAYPWEYQLTDPQIFPAVRAHLARMNPAEARVSLIGQNPNREVNQQLVNWELNEILITQLMYKVMYSGFMTGHGYSKTGWFYKPALQVKTDRGSVTMRSIQNRADAVFVRFNDLYIPNRNNPDISTQPYLIEHVNMRFGNMLDEQEQTEYWKADLLKKIREKKMFVTEIDYGEDLPEEDVSDEDVLIRSQFVSMLRMTTLDGEEFWRLEDEVDDLLNSKTENRYWHGHYDYLDFAPFPEDDEFFSMGIPHTIADLETAVSSTLNQLLTNARKAGNNMWVVSDDAKQIPDWMFTDRPNGVVRVKGDIRQYQRLDQSQTGTAELLNLRKELQTTVERTSGISSLYASGVASSPSVNKTARGAEIIDNNIDQNLQLLISLFGAQYLKQMGEHFLELNQQYITEDQTFEITGKRGQYEYVQVSPDQISADFKVQASPERLLRSSPAVKLASLQNTISMLEGSKSITTNMKPMYEDLITETPGLENTDLDYVLIDPESKANEVIKAITEGYEPPESKWNDDHKAMMAIIQKDLIDHPEYSQEQLAMFADYLSELKSWTEAKNGNLVVQPPPEPNLMPTDPQALAQSMSTQGDVNPAANLPAPMTQAQIGL